MERTKRSPFLRVAAVMAIVCLAFTCILSGTLAKYTSTASGNASAQVAKWSFTINNTQIATDTAVDNLTLDLFQTVTEATDPAGTTDDAQVKDGTGTAIIAPGTGGKFALDIKNLSEVDATYSLSFTELNNSNIPIQYSLDKTTWSDDLNAVAMKVTDQPIAMENGEETQTIYWRWMFEGTDANAHAGQTNAADTALGIDAQTTAPTVTITVNFSATQVD